MSIALNVITGFLGSGKTSLLTRLLQGESLGDTALLINEFGDVGIDHLLVEEVAPDTVLLPGRVHIGLDQLWQAAETMLGRQLDPPRPATTRSLGMPLVGASLLAKSPRAPRASRMPASSLTIFASKLAPTGGGGNI
jgi:hypothetical protein